MKTLAAIYNVFDGEELLKGSIEQILPHVDKVVAVVQTTSNHGNYYEGGSDVCDSLLNEGLIDLVIEYEPDLRLSASKNELRKRQIGLASCQDMDYFLFMDCDEYYDSMFFKAEKKTILDYDLESSVATIKTYIKSPKLVQESYDDYVVPFICKVKSPDLIGKRMANLINGIDVDPTRSIQSKEVYRSIITMHHYSYVRSDIKRKITNSSAKKNIEKSCLLEDYQNAHAGYLMKSSQKKLIFTNNYFNIQV